MVDLLACRGRVERSSGETPAAPPQIIYRVMAAAGTILLFGLYQHDISAERVLYASSRGLGDGRDRGCWSALHVVGAHPPRRLWSSSVGRKADHRVVDTGPDGIVRHPIYTGITLASVATAAMRGTAAAWFGAAIMTLGWYVKARMEESSCATNLARAYGHARRVPMLVPLTRRHRP